MPWGRQFGDPITPFCAANNARQTGHRDAYGRSGCETGEASHGYMCYNQAPWVDDLDPNLAYGFVYAKQSYAGCNRCFEFDFAQSVGKYEEEWGGYSDVGSMRLSRKRKRMIVQAVAVDASFDDGQFGIFVPGGGVESQWRGCMVQWGLQQRPTLDIGASYGGMLARCQGCADPGRGCVPDRRLNYDELKLCVKAMCNATFGAPQYSHLAPLRTSCEWFADWFELADYPTFRYREVGCPSAITNQLYYSGREAIRGVEGYGFG